VSTYATSTLTGQGFEELRALIQPARTLALMGPSGAGKSSLVNVLAASDVQSTGAVRADDNRGRHTTTSRELIVLPTGGILIDTPGLRGLALWDADAGVAATFADIEALAAGCRFGDCSHRSEPDCAVQAALASGALDRRRLESYHKLEDELAALTVRQDEQARRPTGRPSPAKSAVNDRDQPR
jgi:ribosome biogenesis GTPase